VPVLQAPGDPEPPRVFRRDVDVGCVEMVIRVVGVHLHGPLGNWVAPDVEQQLFEFLEFRFPGLTLLPPSVGIEFQVA
jgi:hypothetical protein